MSARTRTVLIVAVVAAVAAAVVAGATVLDRRRVDSPAAAERQPQPRKGFPPLELSFGLRDDAEAVALRRAAMLHESGKRKEAAAIFARHDSLEAKLGAAFAAWPASEERIEQLGALYPRSALVQLHLGLSRFWAGTGGALTAWREARDVEPDTPYAVRAADFIYARDFAPGLPGFIVSFDYRLEGDTPGGAAEAACGRPHAARAAAPRDRAAGPRPAGFGPAAFAEAVELAPNDVDALVADAVGRYDKANPSAAFSRLGPLSRRFPNAATVRFHLGLLLLWQKDLREATRQLELARKAEPRSKLAAEATRFLDAVRNAGTS